MVKIKKIRIDGLYSYHHSREIFFGDKNIILGPNDAGKTSIFKALDFLLVTLARYDSELEKPWHELREYALISLDLHLSDIVERRILLDLLSVKPDASSSNTFHLESFNQEPLLLEKVKNVTLTVIWDVNNFRDDRHNFRIYLHVPALNLKVHSNGFNSGCYVHVDKSEKPTRENPITLVDIINSIDLEKNSEEKLKEKFPEESETSIEVYNIHDPTQFTDKDSQHMVLTAPTTVRLVRLFKYSGIESQQGQNYSFFYIFSNLLKERITLISQERRFRDSEDLVKTPLKEDGSNLQSYLFWLQSSDDLNNKQTCQNIKKCFQDVMSSQKLSFDISLSEKEEEKKEHWDWGPKSKIPDKVKVIFLEKVKDSENKYSFNSVGAGVRECLFLITKCLSSQHGVIAMDEPALNLHPLQISLLMKKIFSLNDPKSESQNQIIIITHSSALASLDTLTAANEIIRIRKKLGSSLVVQPDNENKRWLASQLPTFHLFKPDVLFSKVAILVEGPSDKIFLDTLLKRHDGLLEVPGDSIYVLDVGGKKSFPKFQRLMEIFGIPYLVLADNDVQGRFNPSEINLIGDSALDENKKIYVLKVKNLEAYLASLNPELFKKISEEYERKPEVAYYFINELLENKPNEKIDPIIFLIKHAAKMI